VGLIEGWRADWISAGALTNYENDLHLVTVQHGG
jgi:hypothetical protein